MSINTMSEVQKRNMLFSVTIKQWSGRVTDKKETQKVTNDNGARPDAVKVNKKLVFSNTMKALTHCASEARVYFYEHTAAWSDDGRRICSATNFLEITNKLNEYKDEFFKLVSVLKTEYPDLVEQAKNDLGTLFNQDDYPDSIEQNFSFDVRVEPIPNVDDIRISVSEEERERIKETLTKQIEASMQNAKHDVINRVLDVVKRITDTLPKYNPAATSLKDKGVFRDTIVTNVDELSKSLDGLNIDDDPTIADIKSKLSDITMNGAVTGKMIRDNGDIRKDVTEKAQKLQSILSSMVGFAAV